MRTPSRSVATAAASAVAKADRAGAAGSAGTADGTIAGMTAGVAAVAMVVATVAAMMVAGDPGGTIPGVAILGQGLAGAIRRVRAGTVQVHRLGVESGAAKGVRGLQMTAENCG